jgi:hypothetical protein
MKVKFKLKRIKKKGAAIKEKTPLGVNIGVSQEKKL